MRTYLRLALVFISTLTLFTLLSIWPVRGAATYTVTAPLEDHPTAPVGMIPLADVALSGVSLEGPAVGVVGASYTFTATVSPGDATQPVNYLWEATGQAPVGQVGGLSTSAAFTWSEPGAQVITVTAENGAGASVQQVHPILIQQVPLDIAVVFDVSGSMDYETNCFGCWRKDFAKDVVAYPFPTNGTFHPAHYDPYEVPDVQQNYVPESNLCTAEPAALIRDGYYYSVHEAEYYSQNDTAGSPQGWDFDLRMPGQGFWALQRIERGSNKAFIRAHPYVTYSQSNLSIYPQLQGASYNAECFDAQGQCWRTRGDALGETAPGNINNVPFVEYDFTVDWPDETHIWIRAQGGSQYSLEWAGHSPTMLIPYRKAIFFKVDSLFVQGGNFNNVVDVTTPDSINDSNWRWVKLDSEALAPGQHTLRLYQGSTAYSVDKVIFTNNPWGNTGDAIPNSGSRIGSGSTFLPTYIPLRDTLQLNGGQGPDATPGSTTREACNVCNPIYGQSVTPSQCTCRKTWNETGFGTGAGCTTVLTATNQARNDLFSDIQPLRAAKESVKNLALRLDPKFDQIGFVVFSSNVPNTTPREKLQCLRYASTLYGDQSRCYDKSNNPITYTNIIRGLESTTNGGSTNIPQGMMEGMEELGIDTPFNSANINSDCSLSGSSSGRNNGSACDRRGGARRILILMTDGSPNGPGGSTSYCPNNLPVKWNGVLGKGARPYDCSISYAWEAYNNGVTVYTIGIGTGVNIDLLTAMAEGQDPNPMAGDDRFYFNSPCGRYFHAANLNNLEGIMAEISNLARSCLPHLSLSKSGPAAALAGEPITYTLTVTNEGVLPLTDLVITDVLPVGTVYLGGGTLLGDEVSWTLDNLAVGETAQVSFTLTATASITNSNYRVSGEGVNVPGLLPVFTEVTPVPVLAISKRGPAAALIGQPITYTLTVTNSGAVTATNLTITDTLPAGAVYAGGGTRVGEVISWTLDSLGIGEVAEFIFTVTATQTITNSDYRVEADGGFEATGQNSVSTQVTAIPLPVLALSKTGPATALAGQPVTYTLTLTNSGTATATNLVITDAIPAGAGYVSGGTKVGGVVSWTLASLSPESKTTLTFVVTASQSITNSRYLVRADGGIEAEGEVAVVTLIKTPPPGPVPTLKISKRAPLAVSPGGWITYTLTVTNVGTAVATNLVITDTLPPGATYVEGGTRVGQTVRWAVPSLAANGGVAQVSFVVTATKTLTNSDYGARADGGHKVIGLIPVVTLVNEGAGEPAGLYLPVIKKE